MVLDPRVGATNLHAVWGSKIIDHSQLSFSELADLVDLVNHPTSEEVRDWQATMKCKETYATTGSRMTVRFFGGWDFTPADAATRMPAEAGYAKSVPMGGDLQGAPAGKAPTFLVAALKDPLSGNLDRKWS